MAGNNGARALSAIILLARAVQGYFVLNEVTACLAERLIDDEQTGHRIRVGQRHLADEGVKGNEETTFKDFATVARKRGHG